MTNQEIYSRLESLRDKKYSEFSSALVPHCTPPMLGVRLPHLRELAKELAAGDWRTYLSNASDETFEEIMLQGMTLGYVKRVDVVEVLDYARRFIPKINNWSVNDSFCLTFKIADKHQDEVYDFLMQYLDSKEEYELRMVAIMLMSHFLNDKYIDRVLEILDNMHHDGYYLKMAVAWAVATAFAKYPEKTMAFMKNNHLDDDTYNKAIRKMIESYRVSDEDKNILRTMKRK
ncbi:MAG: DNA alkylation repair protein [Paludibacteraceae bacterium]|nr:DNA alkylation repair protein [Paludibacteraceae bacterium]HOU67649.1 DNA alkylation repair protein [Paludibacteraceae bacterium]HQF49647.1 DNA alkylation repair protein [Paludibacteraceae bacterium]